MTTTLPTGTIPVDVLRALVTIATIDEKTGVLSCRAWHKQARHRSANGSPVRRRRRRFGGDEFVALRPVNDVADARREADEARRAIADLRIMAERPDGSRTITGLTASVGVAVGHGPPLDLTTML